PTHTPTNTVAPTVTGTPAPSPTPKALVICHIPPGNPDNAHTIIISSSAWPAHLAHGDTLGECPPEGMQPEQIGSPSGTAPVTSSGPSSNWDKVLNISAGILTVLGLLALRLGKRWE
ncbi:MAG: hypothetical protein L0332_34105, partial [Chloroflexi bacterium]|nr:hypothetical protein [Chloroflexota bacterium]